MALAIYVDDSGKDDPPVFVLAGFISEAENWALFTDEWNAELSCYPKIDYFKMKEAQARTGQFEGIGSLAIDHKVSRLSALCAKHLDAEFACVVKHSDYQNFFVGQYAPRFDDPYILMMLGLYMGVFGWLNINGRIGERVNFIFDRQLEKESVVREMFAEFAKMPDHDLEPVGLPPTPNFEDDRVTPALQAADLLAWHIRRRFADAEGGGHATLSTANDFIGSPFRLNIQVWDEARLTSTIEKLRDYSESKGNLTPYQALWAAKYLDIFISRANEALLLKADKEASDRPIPLFAIQAPQMKRFLLVRKCPHDDSPHLHRRASGACLADF